MMSTILKASPRVLISDHSSDPFGMLREVLSSNGVNNENICSILTSLRNAGVSSTNEMIAISRDLIATPIDLSEMIKRDFEVKGLLAHQLRSALMVIMTQPIPGGSDSVLFSSSAHASESTASKESLKSIPYCQYRVQKRKTKADAYGLKRNDIPPLLRSELSEFLTYMTEKSPSSQEPPSGTARQRFTIVTLPCSADGGCLSIVLIKNLPLNVKT